MVGNQNDYGVMIMEQKLFSIFNPVSAFVIAILSGLGVGSGGLLVVYLTATGQMDAASARSTNLLFFVISASTASVLNLRSRKFDPRLIFLMCSFGIIGCIGGTFAAIHISAETVRGMFGGMLVLSGLYVLLSGIKKPRQTSGKGTVRIKTERAAR